MRNSRESQIDIAQIRALFGGLDPDTQDMLLEAAAADFDEWTEKLVDAWAKQDMDQCQRARHSLKGLCGNFGAIALLEYCESDLSGSGAVQELRACRDDTLHALAAVARDPI